MTFAEVVLLLLFAVGQDSVDVSVVGFNREAISILSIKQPLDVLELEQTLLLLVNHWRLEF